MNVILHLEEEESFFPDIKPWHLMLLMLYTVFELPLSKEKIGLHNDPRNKQNEKMK